MLLLATPTIATAVTSQVVGILDGDTIGCRHFYQGTAFTNVTDLIQPIETKAIFQLNTKTY